MSQNLFSQLLVNLVDRQNKELLAGSLADALGGGKIPGVDHARSGSHPQFLFKKILTFFQREPLHALCDSVELLSLLDEIIQLQPDHLFAHELSILLHRYAIRIQVAHQDCESLQQAGTSLQHQIQRFQEDAKSKCFDKEEIVRLINQKFGERREALAKRQKDICSQVNHSFKHAIAKAQSLAEHFPLIGYFRLAMLYKQWRTFLLNDDLTYSRCNKYYALYLQKVIQLLPESGALPLLSVEEEDYSELLSCCMEDCEYPSSSVQMFSAFIRKEAEVIDKQANTYAIAQSGNQNCHSMLEQIMQASHHQEAASHSLLNDIIDALKLLEITNVKGELPADNVSQLKNLLTSWQEQLKDFFLKQGVKPA